MDIFPSFAGSSTQVGEELPECKDILWDADRACAVFRGGEPVIVTGLDAVRGWIHRALSTIRGRAPGQSWEYGCEVEALVGLPYTADLKKSEAERYINDALLVNPYITSVDVTDVSFTGSNISISTNVSTIYGEVTVNVSI